MRTILLASAAILALSPMAYAEVGHHPATSDSAAMSSDAHATNTRLRANLRSMLQKSGYTDIRMAPTSFMVRAKDGDGDPVVMSISPDSFTEVAAMSGGDAASRHAGSNSQTTTGAAGSDRFVAVTGSDDLSSKLVGLDVYNENNQDIGEIKDIALNHDGEAQAYILSVGGFLGIGDHFVAVNPSAVKVTYNDSDKKWHASMNATSDQLKKAPEFKYTGRWASRI
jgi:hypothetical protein